MLGSTKEFVGCVSQKKIDDDMALDDEATSKGIE